MKRFVIIIFPLAITLYATLFAQPQERNFQGSIRGYVYDSDNMMPLEYASDYRNDYP